MTAAANQRRRLRVGVLATLLVSAVVAAIAGAGACLAAAAFGALATVLHLMAAHVVGRLPSPDVTKGYAVGMLLRSIGVALLALAILLDPATFPPGASAAGYLGSVLPLLYLETRLA